MTPAQNKQLMRVLAGRLERPTHTHTDVLLANALVERELLVKTVRIVLNECTNIVDAKNRLGAALEEVDKPV